MGPGRSKGHITYQHIMYRHILQYVQYISTWQKFGLLYTIQYVVNIILSRPQQAPTSCEAEHKAADQMVD